MYDFTQSYQVILQAATYSIPISQKIQVRFRDVKKLAQSHTAIKQYIWDLILGLPIRLYQACLGDAVPNSTFPDHGEARAWKTICTAAPSVLEITSDFDEWPTLRVSLLPTHTMTPPGVGIYELRVM